MMRRLLQIGPRRGGIMPTAGSNCFHLILVLALLDGYCIGQSPATAGSKKPHQEEGEMRRVTVDISALSGSSTLMMFLHKNPPPWPQGNYLELSSKTNADSGLPTGEWRLANMHAENYAEITKRRHFKTLEFGLMPYHQRCFVVDSRVPREWFLAEPSVFELEERLSLRARFPSFFRKNPVADSMVGTKWALVSRNDPGGLSERILPGEKLRFGVTDLTCEAVAGTRRGERLWEVRDPPVSLCVYEVVSPGAYTGASFRLTRTRDELVLVATGKLNRSAGGTGREGYDFAAKATYRREP
jgi:hypothetical protein